MSMSAAEAAMNPHDVAEWRKIVQDAHRTSDPEGLDLIALISAEAETAKQELRAIGFGCTGMGPLATVREAIAYMRTSIGPQIECLECGKKVSFNSCECDFRKEDDEAA